MRRHSGGSLAAGLLTAGVLLVLGGCNSAEAEKNAAIPPGLERTTATPPPQAQGMVEQNARRARSQGAAQPAAPAGR